MDNQILARLGAVAFVTVVAAAAVIGMSREETGSKISTVQITDTVTDPLREEQRRCQILGKAAANNPECLKVWAETRDRFLGRAAPVEGR